MMTLKNSFLELPFYLCTFLLFKIENNMAPRLKVMLGTEFLVIGIVTFLLSLFFQFLLSKLNTIYPIIASLLIYSAYILTLFVILNSRYSIYFTDFSTVLYFSLGSIILFLFLKLKNVFLKSHN